MIVSCAGIGRFHLVKAMYDACPYHLVPLPLTMLLTDFDSSSGTLRY